AKPPFAEVAEGRFFCFFFLVKKRKVLKVLWFWSALPTASQSTHFMNIKYSVLYFTWKMHRIKNIEEQLAIDLLEFTIKSKNVKTMQMLKLCLNTYGV